jgi:hypothetical protein
MTTLSQKIEDALDEITIADLCGRAERLGLARAAGARYVYAI